MKNGRNCKIWPDVKIYHPQNVVLGDNCEIFEGTMVKFTLRMGNRSHIGPMCQMNGECEIIIGENCAVGGGSIFYSISNVPAPRGKLNIDMDFKRGSIVLEDDVYVGAGVIILPNCRLRRGCVVGAGAVVLQDTTIPPYEVWAGAPARRVGERK